MHIGAAQYSILVVPPIFTLQETVVEKIKQFSAKGGTVVVFDAPFLVEQICCNVLSIGQEREFIAILQEKAHFPAEVVVRDFAKKSVIVTQRCGKHAEKFLFISNQGMEQEDVIVLINDAQIHSIKRWSLEDGQSKQIAIDKRQAKLLLSPFESCLLELCTSAEPQSKLWQAQAQKVILSSRSFTRFVAHAPNVYRLAAFEVSLNQKKWHRAQTPTVVEQLSQGNLISAQQLRWYGKFGTPKKPAIAYPISLYYKQMFWIEHTVPGMVLMMDKHCIMGEYRLYLNGHKISKESFNPFFFYDHQNIGCSIDSYLHQGENQITIDILAQNDADGLRDQLYLLGDFGVYTQERGDIIDKQPTVCNYTQPYVQGYPYYSGALSFSQQLYVDEINDLEISFDFANTRYDVMELTVNDRPIGIRAFTPYCWYVSKQVLQHGNNTITLCVTNTLSPMLEGTVFNYRQHKTLDLQQVCRANEEDV